jgi:exodeoxyribonuclease VII large subunit
VPDRAQLQSDLFNLQQNIHKNMQNRYEVCYNNFVNCTARLAEGAAMQKINDGATQTERLAAELQRAMQSALQQKRQSLAHAAALADSLSPYRVLARGYAMLIDAHGDVCTVQQLEPGETITLQGSAAKAQCVVTSVEQKTGLE